MIPWMVPAHVCRNGILWDHEWVSFLKQVCHVSSNWWNWEFQSSNKSSKVQRLSNTTTADRWTISSEEKKLLRHARCTSPEANTDGGGCWSMKMCCSIWRTEMLTDPGGQCQRPFRLRLRGISLCCWICNLERGRLDHICCRAVWRQKETN